MNRRNRRLALYIGMPVLSMAAFYAGMWLMQFTPDILPAWVPYVLIYVDVGPIIILLFLYVIELYRHIPDVAPPLAHVVASAVFWLPVAYIVDRYLEWRMARLQNST